jgi:hypothetical protein
MPTGPELDALLSALAALASEGLRVTSRAGHHETGLRAAGRSSSSSPQLTSPIIDCR